ncbi:P-II family nitrogen regulator [Caenispirillum salinarum]|uniref:P-II family nitrogen regulator n=1 Tax=Caenispirillum salinarum TaxID=859058 RepID=UPI00384DECE3
MSVTSATKRKRVTIITEAAIEGRLLDDVEKLGAHGYTISEARGKGGRGVRSGSWGPSANIRVEIICDDATADKIMRHLWDHYYNDYAMILFAHDVEVLRPEKF